MVPIVMSLKSVYSLYKEDKLIRRVMSDEAVEAVKENPAKRLYNDYNLGEALIYNDIPVFFDARADLYAQEDIMADGISLAFLEQANADAGKSYVDVNELLDKYEFDAVLTLKERALYSYMISHPEQFEYIYEDDSLAYYRVIRE